MGMDVVIPKKDLSKLLERCHGVADKKSAVPALANVLLAGRTLGSMITPEEWAEMKSWPPDSCEGAFLREPRNAPHVQRMERVVGR